MCYNAINRVGKACSHGPLLVCVLHSAYSALSPEALHLALRGAVGDVAADDLTVQHENRGVDRAPCLRIVEDLIDKALGLASGVLGQGM